MTPLIVLCTPNDKAPCLSTFPSQQKGPSPNPTKPNQTPMHAMPLQHTEHSTMLSGAAALPKGIQQAQKAKSKGEEDAPRERCIKQCNGNAGLQQHCHDTAHIQTQLRMHYHSLSLPLIREREIERRGMKKALICSEH